LSVSSSYFITHSSLCEHYLAQKAMNCRDMEKVMDAFAKINLAPVTISKRHNVKYLGNIYTYLLTN